MWTFFALKLFAWCSIVNAVPTQNDIVKSFQTSVHQQDLQSILISIEERLRNLDNIYSMHLSPTLEEKLEQYQRKLESIDTKIIRLESLVMLNLDKISENISTKNFKDDIAKTNLMKKVDAVYESLNHRMGYVDRKFETSVNKIQSKLDTTLTRLERMEDGFTRRNEDIDLELSDAIAAIDDLKTSFKAAEESIVNNTNENFEISLKEHMLLMKSFNDKSNSAIQTLYENVTRDFDRLENGIQMGSQAINETDRFLKSLKLELKRELNEYAVKVAEMNSENWKTGAILQNKQESLETVINSTKTELENGIRSLMILIGKISPKDNAPQSDQGEIEKLKNEIDSNFKKVFYAQDLFMDNCYRLQMDESQIESKISDILEKLIETFDKKTTIEIKDIKNLEKLIKNHDAHISRHLYQAGTNIVTTYEKMTKEHRQFSSDLKQVSDHLNALFALIRDTLADENGSLSSKNVNLLLNEMETKITSLNKQGDLLTNSAREIKEIVEKLRHKNSTGVIDEYFRNMSGVIKGMEAKVNNAYLYYYYNRSKIDAINQNLSRQLQEVIDVVANKNERNETETKDERIRRIIDDIFGPKPEAETQETLTDTIRANETLEISPNNCTSNVLDLIDVRSGFDCDNTKNEQTTQKTPEIDEYEETDTTYQQV
ncbi:uncharacterized protein LOC123012980 isoform X2 [Tribolium madens]|uniref:uncharacterized protein LOC123012980 isoform X2 n=1 Tax=Tribolium madens TaxID=41895 RepID=UPI001CF73BDD|nr:uncharacterized protein LOC123012980 isoform X2 [Tribolium madens]